MSEIQSNQDDYPKALVLVGHHDFEIAWVQPSFVIDDKYVHPLDDAHDAKFGLEYQRLLAKKAAALSLYDAFKWDGPGSIVGDYIPNVEPLNYKDFKGE